MTTTKLRAALRLAIDTNDPRLAAKVCDVLRFRGGLDYYQIAELVERQTGCTPARWEALMYAADTMGD